MTAKDHREWRERLGALALGQLDDQERAETEAHLRGCEPCRREAESIDSVAGMLSLVDPANLADPAPQPPAELAGRVFKQIKSERRSQARTKRRRRFGLTLGFSAAAATAAVALIVVLSSGSSGDGDSSQQLRFASVPPGVSIAARLEPRSSGTQIYMDVAGIRSGTLCRVLVRRAGGGSVSAGSFRYRYDDAHTPALSTGLDLSQVRGIVVKAGSRTFSQPLT